MVKKFLLFSTLFSAFSSVADSACDISHQFIMGDRSSALIEARGKQNQPILTAVTRRVGIDSNSQYGRYMPEFVSQNNFEAESIYFGKSPDSDEVAVIVNNSAYFVTEGIGNSPIQKSAGIDTLYLDIGNDLVTISDSSLSGLQVNTSADLVKKNVIEAQSLVESEQQTVAFENLPKEPGNFVCRVQAPNSFAPAKDLQLRQTEFNVPYSVWVHLYASGGKVNFGSPSRSQRYLQGD